MDRLTDISDLEGWIPARVSWQEGMPLVDWCYLGEQPSPGLFSSDTLNRCFELPFNLLFRRQTSMEVLRQLYEARPGLKPTGFIFHSSRSGSRPISQMLAALPANIVLAEVRSIDSILRAKRFEPSVTDTQRIEWLRLMVSNLAQRHRGYERHLFIKFDSWSIFELPIIELAFPEVPWTFIYRDPVAELFSQMKQRDAHMIPGVLDPQMFGMEPRVIAEAAPEEYCARVLKALFEAALHHASTGGLLINASQLPAALSTISGFFGLSWTDDEVKIMMSAPALKNPPMGFRGKMKGASEPLREAAANWAYPVYEALELARLAQPYQSLAACDLPATVRS